MSRQTAAPGVGVAVWVGVGGAQGSVWAVRAPHEARDRASVSGRGRRIGGPRLGRKPLEVRTVSREDVGPVPP